MTGDASQDVNGDKKESDSIRSRELGGVNKDSNERSSIRSHPSSPSASNHSSSNHSYTSTIGYEQEPWDEFEPRVKQLCEALWPSKSFGDLLATRLRMNKFFRQFLPAPQEPLIERLRGGDYNRITGITLSSSHGRPAQSLILRTSRWDEGNPAEDLAIMSYVRERTVIPVPEIVAQDFSCENALGKPYIIQSRIPGSDLASMWDQLNHAQRCTVACELGGVVRALLALESPMPGQITSGSSLSEDPKIVPFAMKTAVGDLIDEPIQESSDKVERMACQGAADFFKFQFGRWRAYALTRPFPRPIQLFNELLDAVCEMERSGFFNVDRHCLCHVDLHSRNVMAEVQSDGSIKVRAILDWDEAVVAPKFVNCQPPWWLWEEDGDERVDGEGLDTWPYEMEAAEGFPATSAKQELKRLFEENAGPEYCQLAYDKMMRIGRGLFILAKEGLPSNEHFEAAERILKEWNAASECRR